MSRTFSLSLTIFCCVGFSRMVGDVSEVIGCLLILVGGDLLLNHLYCAFLLSQLDFSSLYDSLFIFLCLTPRTLGACSWLISPCSSNDLLPIRSHSLSPYSPYSWHASSRRTFHLTAEDDGRRWLLNRRPAEWESEFFSSCTHYLMFSCLFFFL